jgi:hypothetical protein
MLQLRDGNDVIRRLDLALRNAVIFRPPLNDMMIVIAGFLVLPQLFQSLGRMEASAKSVRPKSSLVEHPERIPRIIALRRPSRHGNSLDYLPCGLRSNCKSCLRGCQSHLYIRIAIEYHQGSTLVAGSTPHLFLDSHHLLKETRVLFVVIAIDGSRLFDAEFRKSLYEIINRHAL